MSSADPYLAEETPPCSSTTIRLPMSQYASTMAELTARTELERASLRMILTSEKKFSGVGSCGVMLVSLMVWSVGDAFRTSNGVDVQFATQCVAFCFCLMLVMVKN